MLPCIAVWLPCVYRASAYQAHYLFAWFPIVGVNSLLYSCVYELMTHTVSRSCTEISFSFCTRTLISCLNSLSLCECLSSLTRHVSQSGNSLFKKKAPSCLCLSRNTNNGSWLNPPRVPEGGDYTVLIWIRWSQQLATFVCQATSPDWYKVTIRASNNCFFVCVCVQETVRVSYLIFEGSLLTGVCDADNYQPTLLFCGGLIDSTSWPSVF